MVPAGAQLSVFVADGNRMRYHEGLMPIGFLLCQQSALPLFVLFSVSGCSDRLDWGLEGRLHSGTLLHSDPPPLSRRLVVAGSSASVTGGRGDLSKRWLR